MWAAWWRRRCGSRCPRPACPPCSWATRRSSTWSSRRRAWPRARCRRRRFSACRRSGAGGLERASPARRGSLSDRFPLRYSWRAFVSATSRSTDSSSSGAVMVEPDRQALDVHAGRRAVLAGAAIAVAAAMVPRTARAQSLAQMAPAHRIGWLSPAAAEAGAPQLHALREGRGELGYREGRNLVIETRWAEGGSEQLSGLARELAKLKVDVICTAGTQATRAARDATSTIPVVFANVAFPVQQ